MSDIGDDESRDDEGLDLDNSRQEPEAITGREDDGSEQRPTVELFVKVRLLF